MPQVKHAGAKLYWEREGSGPPLVLAAGLGGSAAWWEPNRAALASRFTLILFDQRGSGRSSKIKVKSIEQMADDLVAVLDDAGVASAHFLGHSTGGAIGLAVALDHPGRLKSLLLYACTSHGDAYRRRIFELRRRVLEALGREAYARYSSLLLYPPYWINDNDERLGALERESARALGSPAVQASRLAAILAFDRRAELGRIAVPTLVLCADDDILTPRYFSEDYARLIPEANNHWEPRGGHALSRTEPQRFNRIALEFFTAAESNRP
ncbi:MAG TPA: alpha/beta hydrolase [Burkholderiales bacterium]|nr:alpha/beta hydrolase [Burkholderiales bacterium]